MACIAIAAGVAQTGVSFACFLQPAGFLIVIGGTIGITIITTPRPALQRAGWTVINLYWPNGSLRREEVVEGIRLICPDLPDQRPARG